jgi:hypothetical protein
MYIMHKEPPQKTKRKILKSKKLVATYEYPHRRFLTNKNKVVVGIFYVVTRHDIVHGPYQIDDSRFSSIIK